MLGRWFESTLLHSKVGTALHRCLRTRIEIRQDAVTIRKDGYFGLLNMTARKDEQLTGWRNGRRLDENPAVHLRKVHQVFKCDAE